MTDPQPEGYSIAVAAGPDGKKWLLAADVAQYINDTALYVRDNEEFSVLARGIASGYLTAIAASFMSAEVEPSDDDEATQPVDEPTDD